MSALFAKFLTNRLMMKITKMLLIAIIEIMVKKTDNTIDDELFSKIKEALNDGGS